MVEPLDQRQTPPRQEPLQRRNLVDQIVERLKGDIVAGRYAVHDTLPPERELASKLGVTRASLKHALVRLEQLGLIRTRHGVGSNVQDYRKTGSADLLSELGSAVEGRDAALLPELLEARVLFAGAFVRLAARHRKPKHLRELRALCAELTEKRHDLRECQRIENEIFRALARASQNRPFVFLTNSISRAYRANLAAYESQFSDTEWVIREIEGVVDAVERGDEAAALRAVEAYFEEAGRRVMAGRRRGKKQDERG
jgi:GntR family transcriptional repressor for pyruvate dehydrogenase complex